MSDERLGAAAAALADGRMGFDLTAQPWIPVLLKDGDARELSLREVFSRADEIRRLAGDLPTQDFVLLRLLLAILHDAVDGPADAVEWAELWDQDEPFAHVPDYLEEHRGSFDLLDPERPFFQTPGLRTAKDEVSSLDRIVADVPNNEAFFTMRARGAGRLGFAEAARWLVHTQAYDTSGIKSGAAVGDLRVRGGKVYPLGVAWAGNLGGVSVEGTSLRETLLLNLVAASHLGAEGDRDAPAWRLGVSKPGTASDLAERPYGPRDLYTWQARRIRLHFDASGVTGVMLTYGDPLGPQNKHPYEPFTGWRRSKPQEKKLDRRLVYMPREHQPERAAWRGLASLIAAVPPQKANPKDGADALSPRVVGWMHELIHDEYVPADTFIRLRTYGALYGTQQSVIDDVLADHVGMRLVVLATDLRRVAVQAVEEADKAVVALAKFAGDLADAVGAEPDARRNAVRDRAYGALDQPYRNWLAGLEAGADPEARAITWRRTVLSTVRRIGRDLVAAAGPAAWEGRIIGNRWVNAASAEHWFHHNLRTALPLPAQHDGLADEPQEAAV